MCVCGGGVQKERPITCTDVVISKRTVLVVHWNAALCWYLQQEQGCGSAGTCALKTVCAKRSHM